MTGLAQLKLCERPLSAAEKAELDMQYVEHRSLWLDLKIMALTVWFVLRPRRRALPNDR
jgi:lipopolysaccharide/colanic/teichoic acid biosynthesis glycosyltransferase